MPIHQASGFEYRLKGPELPNIVFFNGFRMHFNSWQDVELKCNDDLNLLFFNRLGIGHSLKATEDQSGEVVTDAIYRLLMELNPKAPWLIVAHSLGGLYANLFARRHPSCIRGILFVESAHPNEIADRLRFEPPKWVTHLNNGIKRIEKVFDRYKFSEDECIRQTVAAIEDAQDFPNIPITVITGTKKLPFVPTEAHTCHLARQQELLTLSENSTSVIASSSGHFPQVTEPEIVVAALNELLTRSK